MQREEVLKLLRKRLDEEGSVALAKRLGVTRQAIWAVLCGKWGPGSRLLRALGLVETTTVHRQGKPRKKVSPYKRAANYSHRLVKEAILSGLLPNLKLGDVVCVDCKVNLASVYDHRDYSKPLTVEPVCHMCNTKRGPAILS